MRRITGLALFVAAWMSQLLWGALALNDTIGVTPGSGKTANLISFGSGNVISEVGICDATTANQCATVSAAGAVKVDGSAVTQPVSGTFFQATQPISAVSLPLPTGAFPAGGSIGNTTFGSTQSGNWTSRIVGNAGAILDFNGQNAVSPGGSFLSGCQFNTAPSAISNGNSSPIQCDSAANALVNVKTGTLSASQTGTWTVQPGNTANTTAWLVTGTGGVFPASQSGAWNVTNITGTVSLPTLAATSTLQTSGGQKTQIVDGSGNVIASTSNNLNVQCANCSGSGVSTADEATYTPSVSLFAGGGGFFQTTATSNALTSGQQGMFQMTANRALFSNLRNAAGTEIGTAGAPLQVSLANTAANATAVAVGATIANGADAAQGTTTDNPSGCALPTTATACTIVQLLKVLNNTANSAVPFPVNITPTDCSGTITTGGTAQNAFTASATKHGYFILNLSADPMWISNTGTAVIGASASYLLPAGSSTISGGSFTSPTGYGMNTALSVIAATTADKFSCTYY